MAFLERQTAELGNDEHGDILLVDVDPNLSDLVFRIGKHKVHVSKAELWGFCFAIGDEKTQEQLMPVRQTEVMEYIKKHVVELKKDMRKGDKLVVRCRTSVPLTVVEGLQGLVPKPQRKSLLTL